MNVAAWPSSSAFIVFFAAGGSIESGIAFNLHHQGPSNYLVEGGFYNLVGPGSRYALCFHWLGCFAGSILGVETCGCTAITAAPTSCSTSRTPEPDSLLAAITHSWTGG